MKFSVLLPTKNRLDLLKLAVGSVLRQDETDWEIVVSDNASTEDVRGWVASLGDPRVRCVRSDEPLTVTANWNRALEHSRGDYVVMLGDDDALLDGFFRHQRALIERFDGPEFIYAQAVQFAYPGVIPGHAKPFIQIANSTFLRGESEPYVLDSVRARSAVAASAAFRVEFAYNMQYGLVRRSLIERLSGDGRFYRSPYPDYYATNAMLLEAERVIVQPRPMTVVGISPKSFGWYYFNGRETDGVDFLRNVPDADEVADLADVILAGSNMNTSWLVAMETMSRRTGRRHGVRVERWRYRFMQLRDRYMHDPEGFRAFLDRHGTVAERVRWRVLHRRVARLYDAGMSREAAMATVFDAIHVAYPRDRIFVREVGQTDVLQLVEALDPDALLNDYLAERRRWAAEAAGRAA